MRIANLLIFIFFSVIFSCQTLKAQHLINFSNVDLIAYDDVTDFAMFEKIGHDSYAYTAINFGHTTEGFLYTLLSVKPDDTYTLDDIKEDFTNLVYVDEMQSNSHTTWKQFDWFLQSEDTSDTTVNVLKFTEKGLAYYQELIVQETNDAEAAREKVNKTWEIDDMIWLEVIVLNFGNGKEMLLLNEDDDIEFIGIPLSDKMIIISNAIDITTTLPTKKNTYAVHTQEALAYFEFDYSYKIKTDDTQKYHLYDNFRKDLLQTSFDTIMHNNFFVVGKEKNQYKIYNSILTPIAIPNIRKVYFREDHLEVLTNDSAFYVDIFGNQMERLSHRVYEVCGTVSSVRHEIIRDDNKKYPYTVKIIHRDFAYIYDHDKTYTLTNLKKNQTLSFINNTTSDYSDENDDITGARKGFPDYLKVFNGEKYGLFSYKSNNHYSISTEVASSGKNARKRFKYSDFFLEMINELPVKYDSITINQDNLILFFKNHKAGIFPHHKKTRYKILERITASFYKIMRGRKSGWLDINTMEEFFFD